MNVAYAVLGIDGTMYMLDMQCSVGYRWHYVHVGYAVLCAYGIVRMLYM